MLWRRRQFHDRQWHRRRQCPSSFCLRISHMTSRESRWICDTMFRESSCKLQAYLARRHARTRRNYAVLDTLSSDNVVALCTCVCVRACVWLTHHPTCQAKRWFWWSRRALISHCLANATCRGTMSDTGETRFIWLLCLGEQVREREMSNVFWKEERHNS